MAKVLTMNFVQANSGDASLKVTQPIESLTADAIRTAAAALIAADVFKPDGSGYAKYDGAKLVETTTTEFDS